MILTFVVAHQLQNLGTEVLVVCDSWDNAKGEQAVIEGVTYQRSLRETGKLQCNLADYEEVLKILAAHYNVRYIFGLRKSFSAKTSCLASSSVSSKIAHYWGKVLRPPTEISG